MRVYKTLIFWITRTVETKQVGEWSHIK